MRVSLRQCCLPAVGLLVGATLSFSLLHLQPRDVLDRPVPVTYRRLLRGPLRLRQWDPVLVSHVTGLIQPPSLEPYRLERRSEVDEATQELQALLHSVVGRKSKGRFLEVGAGHGGLESSTFLLERDLGWTGLLVEADKWSYVQLRLRHRKAHALNVCISPTPYPQELGFDMMAGSPYNAVDPEVTSEGRLYGGMRLKQCVPLYSVLLAAGLTSLDLLCLDVEGIELAVLRTLPLSVLDIQVILVDCEDFTEEEDTKLPQEASNEKKIHDHLVKNNYTLAKKWNTHGIFVKLDSEFAVSDAALFSSSSSLRSVSS